MPDESLLMLQAEVRCKLLRVLEGLDDKQARWAPPGLHNTILWHAGHSYVVAECLSLWAIERQPQVPAGWMELFSWDSRPAAVLASAWPPLAEVVRELKAQYERLRDIIAGLTPEQLAAPSAERDGAPVRYSILHALHDEACHTGEIWLLRKLYALAGP